MIVTTSIGSLEQISRFRSKNVFRFFVFPNHKKLLPSKQLPQKLHYIHHILKKNANKKEYTYKTVNKPPSTMCPSSENSQHSFKILYINLTNNLHATFLHNTPSTATDKNLTMRHNLTPFSSHNIYNTS